MLRVLADRPGTSESLAGRVALCVIADSGVLHALLGQQCFHWSTHTGAELGLLVIDGFRRCGFEVKRSEAPRLTRSMRSAVETLGLDRLDVVHLGTERYQLAERVRALPAGELLGTLPSLTGRQDNPGPG